MDIAPLMEAGLTEGETKVYLALLEIGSSTSGPIVERSGVAKSIVYPLLNKLMHKGLVSCIVRQKTKHFQAAEPSKILEYVDERSMDLARSREKVREIIPELMLRQALAEKSEARMYFGFRGLRTANEHYYGKLAKREEYVCLGVPAYQPEEQHLYWQRDHVRRAEAGITCRLLFNKGIDPRVVRNRNSFPGAQARVMDAEIKTPALFIIFKDTTLIVLQSPEAICVEIVNQHIADSFKAYFEEFWKRSEPNSRRRKDS